MVTGRERRKCAMHVGLWSLGTEEFDWCVLLYWVVVANCMYMLQVRRQQDVLAVAKKLG